MCIVRIITFTNSPAITLTISLADLAKLLDLLEMSKGVKTYSVDSGFGFIVDKNNIDLLELYINSFCGLHPPSFTKWLY